MLSAQWNGIKLSVLHLEAETFPMQNTVFRSLMIHCCLYFETLEIKIYIFVYFRFSFFLLVVHSFLHLFNTFLIDDLCAKIRIHTRTPKTKDIPRATKMRRLQQPTKSALGSGKYISFDFYCGRWHSIPLGLLLNTSFSTDTDKHWINAVHVYLLLK